MNYSEKLKVCPFCGAGETIVVENNHWTGMRNQLLSAEVRHWCAFKPHTSAITIKAPTVEGAIDLWNTRTPTV